MREDPGRGYWERNATRYDRSMVLLGGPMPRTLELVAEAVRGAGEVLEVAAGTGLVTEVIARCTAHVTATDYAPAMVEQLRRRVEAGRLTNVSCRVADLYALDLTPGSVDAVVAANVLHLVPDLDGALAALARVLRPGGLLVAPTYAHDETLGARVVSRVLGALAGFPGQRRFTRATLAAALERAGFSVERLEVVPGLIPIVFAAGRKAAHER
ncbi:MAG: class I SAM-dependent methyltransferase [Anaeromyxobacteraceae bacterium]